MCELGRSRPEIDYVRTPQYDLKMEWITINALSMLGALTWTSEGVTLTPGD